MKVINNIKINNITTVYLTAECNQKGFSYLRIEIFWAK
jgi:hypothetical protein